MRFAVLLCLPTVALADPGEIVVTGRGLDPVAGTAAYGSVVVPRERLAGDASGRLEDALRDVAGFQQFRRTDSRAANPTSQGATLRGLGGNAASRALLLLDSVPQADPFTGFIPFTALIPDRLEQARITRGGGSGPFGAGAVAGTIELESGGPGSLPPLSARAFRGSRDSLELGAGTARTVGAGFVTAYGRWDRGDGYVLIPRRQRGTVDVPARYDSWSGAFRGVAAVGPDLEVQANGLVFSDHRLRGQAGTASVSRGADASVRLIARGRWRAEALAYVQERGFSSGFVSTAANRATATPSLDQYNTPATGVGGKLELRPPVGEAHTLRIGVDARRSSGATHERFRFQAGDFTRLRRAGGNSSTAGLFVEEAWTLGPLTLTGGGRVDRWTIRDGSLVERDRATGVPTLTELYPDRAGTRPSGRAGVVYALGEQAALRAAAYTGFRVPTLNELYRPFRVGADATAANAALKLEKLKGAEAGADYHFAGLTLGLTGFWNRLDDAVSNVTLAKGPGTFPQVGVVAAGGSYRRRLNVDAIRVYGIEATAGLRVNDWRLSASYARSDARVRASGITAALDGKRPANSPADQASGTLGWNPEGGPALSATVRYIGTQFDEDLQTRRLPGAVTADAVASLPLGHGLRLVGRAENVFDREVVSGLSADGIVDRGTPRTLWIGLTLGG